MACQCAEHEQQSWTTTAERVRYFPRQLLTADDMQTEQEYFREKLRRHNRLLHGWGVICGLEVVANPGVSATAVNVCPGSALGPWGDEICVEEAATLDLAYCARPKAGDCTPTNGVVVQPDPDAATLLVQIRYVECKSRPMRTLPAGCGCDDTACEYSRLRDGFELRCVVKPPKVKEKPQPFNPKVPPCRPGPSDPWLVLAEVKAAVNKLTIDNEVRRVVRNTPSVLGI
jgi:hypothetical protein